MDVRHDHIDATRELTSAADPGHALLTIFHNRRGPKYAHTVVFFAHYASYFDSGQC